MANRTITTWQGIVAFIGITAGVIPLVRFLVLGRAGSVWSRLFDDAGATLGWAGPLVLVVAAIGLIAGLERRRRYASR